jgi:hypothetical protein
MATRWRQSVPRFKGPEERRAQRTHSNRQNIIMLSPRGVQQLLARSLSALLLSSNEIILLCARREKFPTASSKKCSRKSWTNAKNIIRIKHSGGDCFTPQRRHTHFLPPTAGFTERKVEMILAVLCVFSLHWENIKKNLRTFLEPENSKETLVSLWLSLHKNAKKKAFQTKIWF